MKMWFTSDLHLGHININRLANRPFTSVEELNETLIERWNARVGVDDLVIIVGDICMGKIAESLALVQRLNGDKHLVPGNHDRVWPGNKPEMVSKFEPAYAMVGLTVVRPQITVHFGGRKWRVCHFPAFGDSHGEDRYTEWRPIDDGQLLIHGHTHSQERIRGNQIHVGVDAWDFAPVSAEEIVELVDGNAGDL